MREVNRREFLSLGTLGFFALMTGCATIGINTKEEKMVLSKPNLDPDSIFRASSIILEGNNVRAQGSLLEYDNQFYLYTVKHVVLDLGGRIDILIPGANNYVLTASSFHYWPERWAEDDPVSYFDLNLSDNHPLRQAITDGLLTPLHLNKRLAEKGESVAVPDLSLNNFVIYRVLDYQRREHRYILGNDNKDVVCKGQSGSPILMVEDGQIRNIMFGALLGVIKDSVVPDPLTQNRTCGNMIVAKANG